VISSPELLPIGAKIVIPRDGAPPTASPASAELSPVER
jgi:hypothetical protein